jgi:diaminopimelate decarboxylase
VKLHYAMKANPMPALVCHMAGLVDGIDVASAGELKVALDAGADPREISFRRPRQTSRGELRQAVAAGILINIESFREVANWQQSAPRPVLPARVAVRVNPDFELKSSGMKMGGGAKQFGVDAEQVPELLAEIGRAGLAFEGFHLFAGSQNLAPEAIVEAQGKSYELAVRLASRAGDRPLPQPGRRFRHPLLPGEQPLDLAPIAANLAASRTCRPRIAGRRDWSSNSGAIWSARPASTSAASSIARSRAATFLVCRWRTAPPPLGIGQFRPGDPQELPGGHRQPDDADRA